MKFETFPADFAYLADKFIDDDFFNAKEVSFISNEVVCRIFIKSKGGHETTMYDSRKDLLHKSGEITYKVKIGPNKDRHYFVNNCEIIDERILKEKLEFLKSLFFQKTVTRHFDGKEEQDLNRIVVTPQLREFVNTYLGVVINSLEG